MGSKQSGQTNSTQTYTPPPQVLQNYTDVTNQAKDVAATPYQGYGGQLVAGINDQQNLGIANVNTAATVQNPYNAGATGLAAASSGAIAPTQYSAQELQQYENPYQNDVINATEAQIGNQNRQQAAALQGNAISAGAFGGDRAGVAQAALAGQQDIANNATLANLNTSNFQNAQNQFATQQGVNLGAQQNTAARQLAASQQIGNLGAAAQSEGLAGANAQVNAGTLQQTTQQAQDTAAYNQFLQQQAYPFQTTGWLANIVEGIGSQSGGTTTGQQTTEAGNTLSSAAGGLLGLASFLKDGGRVNGNEIRIPRKAAGGGLSPYNGALDPNGGLGGGSWVTPANLAVGHTQPQGMVAPSAAQDPTKEMLDTAKSVQGLGNAFQNSSLGDTVNDFFQDNFARGGAVRHYDTGGDVSPDALWADADNPHGTGPTLQPNDVTPLTAAANLPTPEAAMAARYATQMPAPQQDGLTPDQKLAIAMGAPTPPSGVTPPPATPGPVGLVAPDAEHAAGLAKLRTAMGGSNAPADPKAIYGSLDGTGVGGVSAPMPTPRPAGLDATAVAASPSVDAVAPGGLGAAVATAGAPTQLPGGGLVAKVPTWKDVQADNAAGTADIASRDGTAPIAPPVAANAPLSPQNVTAYVTNAAQQRGIDPRVALSVLGVESGSGRAYVGDQGSSFGPLQLHYGNIAPGALSHPGLGDAFTAATGLDARDPATWQKQIDFALDQAKTSGWQPWATTRDKLGISNYAGIKQGAGDAPASQAIAGATGAPGRGGAQPGLTSGSYSVPGLGGAASGYNGPPLTANSPVASTDARPAAPNSGGGLLGFHFSDAARQGMLAAGLGMLGGTSMNPWINIGQGGLAGVKQYNDARKLQSEIGLRGAQAGEAQARSGLFSQQTTGAGYDNQIKAAMTKRLLDRLDQHAQEGAAKADAVEKGVTTPTITAPTVAGSAQPPTTAANWSLADLVKEQSQAADDASFGMPGAKEHLAAVNEKMQMLREGGLDPEFAKAKAAQAGQVAGAEAKAKTPYEMVDVQPTPGGPTYKVPRSSLTSGPGVGSPPGSAMDAAAAANPAITKQPEFYADKQKDIAKDETKMVEQYQARQLSRQRLQTIAGILQTYQPGAFAQQKADLVAKLRGVGVPVPDTATANPAAFQEFTKNAIANIFNDVKSVGSGRVLVSEIEGLSKANANPDLQPAAAASIVGQGIGLLDYEDKHAEDYFAWKKLHPNTVDTSEFEIPWAKQNPAGKYVDAATKGIAYSGQQIPAAAQRTTGQTYMTPKGPMTWVGNGWRPAAASP